MKLTVSSSKFNSVSLVKQYQQKAKLTAKLNKKSKFFGTVEMNINHPLSNYLFLKSNKSNENECEECESDGRNKSKTIGK